MRGRGAHGASVATPFRPTPFRPSPIRSILIRSFPFRSVPIRPVPIRPVPISPAPIRPALSPRRRDARQRLRLRLRLRPEAFPLSGAPVPFAKARFPGSTAPASSARTTAHAPGQAPEAG
ncbi:hypothetical protein GCM10018793_65530 [Streptomyces sulfonofaciens]|uniref:Uncharacterized protein n=1 Tax=Streptomyces sulfonofaciens TaxID=68272 RepID=A0A919GNL0_9ACTN|nr:hypothetical protein GCM10018793_65530 [Streptomyces sulfonofaciens]